MKKVFRYLILIGFCSIIWIILNEEISAKNILSGCILGFFSIICTEQFLLQKDHKLSWNLSPSTFMRYLLHLIVQMYASGFAAIRKIISGKINPDIVEISTELEDDLLICILANSITLTPGTITIDKDGQNLKILWLNCVTKDSQKAGEIIKGSFEKILKES